MKFVCERCHTKYSIADEKVRGKVLKVRCKTCTNVITVRETGATIDDLATDAPRDPPIARSGSIEAPAQVHGHQGFAEGDGDTVVAPRAGHLNKLAGLPAAALFAPGGPVAAPPIKRRVTPPPAPAPVLEMDWYLAVDGAQTGPFSRGRLIDKILSTVKDADVHVWNADFDGWKPPGEVPELEAELVRRRRSVPPAPPPPVRRPTAPGTSANGARASMVHAVPAFSDPHTHPAPLENGLSAAVVEPALGKATAGVKKKNGVAARAGAHGIALGDLLGSDSGSTPVPGGAAQQMAAAGGALASPGLLGPATSPSTPILAPAAAARSGKRTQVRLLLGALGVVLVLCGLVSFWMLRKPAVVVAVGEPAAPKPASAGTDFAGMAEQLKKEEVQVPPAPVAPAPSTTEAKTAIVRMEPPPPRGAKGRMRHKGPVTPPPLAQTSPSAASLTAEQRDAANRFGDSSGREVRVPSAGGGGAHSTPAQADISRVINSNRQGIQTCYQRALLRDNTLTHGKVTVRVSIGLSGKVKSVNLDAPVQFRALEPCIRDVMSRWAFPPSSEEYGTEFPVVLQGNQ